MPSSLSYADAVTSLINFLRAPANSDGRALLALVGERAGQLGRSDRTRCREAAQTVVVVLAFAEALNDDSVVDRIATAPLPRLSTTMSFEENRQLLTSLYEDLSRGTGAPLSSVTAAVARHATLLKQLTGAFPELERLRGTPTPADHALARLTGLFGDGEPADARASGLHRLNASALTLPVIHGDAVPAGVQVPTLEETYVVPEFQVTTMDPWSAPAEPSWWQDVPQRSDLDGLLAGWLTSSAGTERPLLVLGEPGSGKSLLTMVVAARLPADEFFTVRVPLRDASASADVQDQIEQGLQIALGEQLTWAEVSRGRGRALPVLLLDGFDDMVAASGVRQTDYLHRITRFQQHEQDLGRPVCVLVTSRLTTAANLHIPQGCVVVRLLPFTTGQISQWVHTWNAANPGHVALPLDDLLRYSDMAEQPLLLLLLMLHHLAGRSIAETGSRGQLYEQLLSGMSRGPDSEYELDKLGVTAFAMFNRGRQWITRDELDHDLSTLLGYESPPNANALTPGETTLGSFFFVQESRVTRDMRSSTFEFLFTSFAEYLLARLVWNTLETLQRELEARARRRMHVDDSELRALLSFSPLARSRPVIGFLREMANASGHRDQLGELLRGIFVTADSYRVALSYEPVRLSMPRRHAVYELNLLTLAAVICDRVNLAAYGITDWRRTMAFWESQVSEMDWVAVVSQLGVEDHDQLVLDSGTPLPSLLQSEGPVAPPEPEPEPEPSGVFISYRRADSGFAVRSIADRLKDHFGDDNVFIDVDSIEPGVDFVDELSAALRKCEVLLAVIGNSWLSAHGQRLHEDDDQVRIEIETALRRGIRVIPLLLEGTEMPRAIQLPDALRKLASRNAVQVRYDTLRQDMSHLVEALEKVMRLPQ
ncbi:TIR domain-containing protein [Lentzea sp. BCCO 10_0856]|uniref:TIR domain-containing protein n=1 Tax=Lentzea miocenica TaxID=3095431 RepID=A0ABU4T7H7_9PSEU|nr:TIR domain-containing protein [Lentzea sp. BCCO 10_0856]MDX8034108.1 TIR domain-containing protein [Lentzea sp. BCCO 10_0856]